MAVLGFGRGGGCGRSGRGWQQGGQSGQDGWQQLWSGRKPQGQAAGGPADPAGDVQQHRQVPGQQGTPTSRRR